MRSCDIFNIGLAKDTCGCGGMADAQDSKSCGGDLVWVQVPPSAFNRASKALKIKGFEAFLFVWGADRGHFSKKIEVYEPGF